MFFRTTTRGPMLQKCKLISTVIGALRQLGSYPASKEEEKESWIAAEKKRIPHLGFDYSRRSGSRLRRLQINRLSDKIIH